MTHDATHPRILVLEDEAEIARLICNALDGYGFRCEHHQTGRRFLQVGLKGQRSDSTTSFVEDLSQCLISLAPLGSLLVVRPNRILMHDGPDRPGRQPDKRLSAAAGKVNGSPVSHSIIIDSQPSGARV